MKVLIISLLFILFLIPDVMPQGTYGELTIKINGADHPLYQHSYALLIGVSGYNNGWPALPGVREDLYIIRTSLEKQGFRVMAIWDPDKDQVDDAITDFIKNYGQDENNRLVIYFAGHGYTSKSSYGELIGYLVPVDAPRPHLGFGQFQAMAVEIAQFDLYSKRIQSKHALFIFDACFSGSLFTGKTLPEPLSVKVLEPVRQFITSGSADEQVPDKSIFCQQFILALDGYGDYDSDGYITGTELGEYLQKSVINYSRGTQHPQFGKIRNPRLDKGEIIFISPQSAVHSPQSAVHSPQSAVHSPQSAVGNGQSEVRSQQSATGSPPDNPSTPTPPPTTLTTPTTAPPHHGAPQDNQSRSTVDSYGELKVITVFSGDFYIDGVFYRRIVANTTVMFTNISSGSHTIMLKGDNPWQKTTDISKDGVTVVEIK